jgi:hypothetical protein
MKNCSVNMGKDPSMNSYYYSPMSIMSVFSEKFSPPEVLSSCANLVRKMNSEHDSLRSLYYRPMRRKHVYTVSFGIVFLSPRSPLRRSKPQKAASFAASVAYAGAALSVTRR